MNEVVSQFGGYLGSGHAIAHGQRRFATYHLDDANQVAQIRHWKINSAPELSEVIQEHSVKAECVAFSPDLTCFATATFMSGSSQASLWDMQTGQMRWSVPLGDHGSYSDFQSIAFCPDGAWLVVNNYKHETYWLQLGRRFLSFDTHPHVIQFLDVRTGKECGQVTNRYFKMFSPDGTSLVTRSDNGKFEIWDVPPQPPFGLNAARTLTLWALVLVVYGLAARHMKRRRS